MVNPPVDVQKAQVRAQRVGTCVTVVIVTVLLLCSFGIWLFFASDDLAVLGDSIRLQVSGVKTAGTVTEVEEHEGVKPNSSGSFTLFVSYQANGQTYTIKSTSTYPPLNRSWVGESMPVIYDPEEPGIAFIDNFQERWLDPVTGESTR